MRYVGQLLASGERLSRGPLILLLFLLATLLLTGCARNPFERQSPHTQWVMAMARGDYDAAQRRLVATDAAAWRAATDQLRWQHGKVKALRRSDIPPSAGTPYQSAIMLIGIDWADGAYASRQVCKLPV